VVEPSAVFLIAGIIAVLVVLLGAMGIVRTMRGKKPIPPAEERGGPNRP
jgi:hypothetical protein